MAGVGYAAGIERLAFRLRRVEVPVLPAGARPIRVLHLSDLHLTPGQARKRDWVRSLADLQPDLVVDTGDNLAHQQAVPMAMSCLEPLLELPRSVRARVQRLLGARRRRTRRATCCRTPASAGSAPGCPPQDLVDGLTGAGWADLTNVADPGHGWAGWTSSWSASTTRT